MNAFLIGSKNLQAHQLQVRGQKYKTTCGVALPALPRSTAKRKPLAAFVGTSASLHFGHQQCKTSKGARYILARHKENTNACALRLMPMHRPRFCSFFRYFNIVNVACFHACTKQWNISIAWLKTSDGLFLSHLRLCAFMCCRYFFKELDCRRNVLRCN